MSVTHRVLYVGIGGTGVHIGKELEIALRRDLCGPDGKALIRKGGAFQKLAPYQLPDYIQTLYFDFDDDAEQTLQKGSDLSTSLLRKNSTVVKSIHASGATSYRSCAEMLRADMYTSLMTKSWLPEKDNEPQVAPLADGAGQFPTVGRAALFLALKRSGIEIQREIDQAINRLVLAGGMLHAMKNESDKPKLLCYVGFSIAGGTGTGIFYDVIHLIESRLNSILDGIEVNIIPLTLLPSAFMDDWKINNVKAGKANAAIALKDLAQLIEHLQKDDDPEQYSIKYPEPFGEVVMTPATIPTAFLFSKPTAIKQDDMFKSMASFVMSQITTGNSIFDESSSKQLKSKQTEMSMFSIIINNKNLTAKPDEFGPGLRPFSPAISSSLSIPLENVADLIARKLISEYIKENNDSANIQSENNTTSIAETLKNMDLEFIVDPVPNKPQALTEEEENIINSRGKQLLNNVSYYKTQLHRWVNDFESYARKSISDASLDWNQEIIRLLNSHSIFNIMRTFEGSNITQDVHSKEGVIGKLMNFGSKISKPQAAPDLPKIKGPKILQKGTNPRVKTEYLRQIIPSWSRNEFKIKWQDAWINQRSKWQRTVDEIKDIFGAVNTSLNRFSIETEEVWEVSKNNISDESILVSGFLPLDSGNLDTLKNDVVKSLTNTSTAESLPSTTELFEKVLPKDIWQEAWKIFNKKAAENFNEAAPEFINFIKIELKNFILEDLQKSTTDGSSKLPSLKNLLIRASRAGNVSTSNQIKILQSQLGKMIPLNAIPDSGPGVPVTEIWINYPLEEKDEQVETYLKHHITVGWPNQTSIINKIKCYPIGGESIFISTYNFANGLLSLEEPKQLFKELHELKNTPEGRELQWRQRLSTDTIYNLASKRDYINAIQYFLVAAWNDQITIEDGDSIHNAKSLSINLKNDGVVNLNLKKFQNFSTVSDLPEAFKEFWISMSMQDSSNWDQLIHTMPNGAEDGDLKENFPKSKIFYEITSIKTDEINELEELIKVSSKERNVAPGVIAKAKLKLDFWKNLLPEALNKTIGAGTYDKLSYLEKAYRDQLEKIGS